MAAGPWAPDSVLGRAFAGPDDEELLECLLESLSALERSHGEAALHGVHREIYLVRTALPFVDNGGFQYFFELSDPCAEETAAALETMGAHQAAAGLRKALAMFPGGRPHADRDQRLNFLQAMDKRTRAEFTACDWHFSSFDIDAFAAAYARAHERDFAGLPEPVPRPSPRSVPEGDADTRSMVEWLRSLGSKLLGRNPAGDVHSVYSRDCELPEGNYSIQRLELPHGRRDTDAILQRLGRWPHVGSIHDLWVRGNHHVGRPGLAALREWTGLDTLNLDSSPIDDPALAVLAAAEPLRSLCIASPNVTDTGLAALGGLTLEELHLSETSAIGATLDSFPRLRSFGVARQRLAPVVFQRLAGLERLETLSLHTVEMERNSFETLRSHPRLRSVYVGRRTHLSVANARALAAMPLQKLSLEKVTFEDGALEVLLHAFPADVLQLWR